MLRVLGYNGKFNIGKMGKTEKMLPKSKRLKFRIRPIPESPRVINGGLLLVFDCFFHFLRTLNGSESVRSLSKMLFF